MINLQEDKKKKNVFRRRTALIAASFVDLDSCYMKLNYVFAYFMSIVRIENWNKEKLQTN